MDNQLKLQEEIISQLFKYCRHAIKKTGWPYVSFIINDGVILARDMNTTLIKFDPSLQCSVTAIRQVQKALETNDLTGCSLFSLFEPTILSFDVALWAGIKDFYWCINMTSAPDHYKILDYSPTIYTQKYPGKITVHPGIKEKQALMFLKKLNNPGCYHKK